METYGNGQSMSWALGANLPEPTKEFAVSRASVLITMDEYDDGSSNADPNSGTDESQNASPALRSGLRPADKAPVCLAASCETSDEDEPTIPYNVEWKLFINHRQRAGE